MPDGAVRAADFDDAVCRALFEGLCAGRSPGELVGEAEDGEARAQALGALEDEALPQDAEEALKTAQQCLGSIRRHRLEEQIAAAQQEIAAVGEGERRKELMEQLNGLLAELDRF